MRALKPFLAPLPSGCKDGSQAGLVVCLIFSLAWRFPCRYPKDDGYYFRRF